MSIFDENDTVSLAELATVLFTLPLPVAIIDLETTGGHFELDRITEIAILRFHEGKISRHQWLVNPQQPISEFITQLTGITNVMVQNAPAFAEIATELLPLLRGHLLIAHNSRFDYTFLRNAFARVKLNFAALTLDTVPFSRKLYPQFFKHNLDVIIERFGITMDSSDRHRAMGDVIALAKFLQCSLRETSSDSWLQQWQQLIRPGYLPEWLSPGLHQQIYTLPDDPGVMIWHFSKLNKNIVQVKERAFTDTIAQLQHKQAQKNWRQATAFQFIPAISLSHAFLLQGRYLQQNPDASNYVDESYAASNWYTVTFMPDQRGQLKARVVKLKPQILSHAPYGLFLHPRAAKRAVAAWARQYDLCPANLDILPQSISHNDPCPKQAAHLCNGHCRLDKEMNTQNQRILHYAPRLPVCEWGKWHHLRITESNCITADSVQIELQAGCIRLDQQHWYFHPLLPKLIKQRLKQSQGIEFLS